jgi:hypothetical protein
MYNVFVIFLSSFIFAIKNCHAKKGGASKNFMQEYVMEI